MLQPPPPPVTRDCMTNIERMSVISQLRAAWFNRRDVNIFTSGVARGEHGGMSPPLIFRGAKKKGSMPKKGKGGQKKGRKGEKMGKNREKGEKGGEKEEKMGKIGEGGKRRKIGEKRGR